MTEAAPRPLTVLVAALGGEGGGVLADWLVAAATSAGLPVQSTSIPGVAQRTGATTYYIEIFPVASRELGGRWPVMALTPAPGNIDLMVASELIEAGRAMQNGYVSPERTVLIASTHRVYAIGEKSAMGDGRFDEGRVHRAAEELARRPVLFDVKRVAAQAGSQINAVLLGAIAASDALPLPRAAFEAAIREGGKAVEPNLRGFAAGWAHAVGEAHLAPEPTALRPRAELPVDRVRRAFPAPTQRILEEGVARLEDYQDAAYATLYLDRMAAILAADSGWSGYRMTAETGRHLALWMSYEDVIRVADLKTRASRLDRVRGEAGAKPGEPVVVVEFLKPGIDELCSVLPPALGRRLAGWAETRGLRDRLNFGMHVRTSTVTGFVLMRALASLRRWRRRTWRFQVEQERIEAWLGAVGRGAAVPERAVEIAECARLIKGYGDTHRRGWANYERILAALIEPAAGDAAAIRRAREAALADPEGDALERALAIIGTHAASAPPRPAGEGRGGGKASRDASMRDIPLGPAPTLPSPAGGGGRSG